jgi:hypothetical protein
MTRVMILPGSTSPRGSSYYEDIYSTIEDEARKRGLQVLTVLYPGQDGDGNGFLSYETAVESTLKTCRQYHPNWLIARSFGCSVAAGILSVDENWIENVEMAILWGPCMRRTLNKIWPSIKRKRDEIVEYRRNGTNVSLDFFEQYPAIEDTIADAKCNIRLIRGSEDIFNSDIDLEELKNTHAVKQPNFRREIKILIGAKHTVTNKNVPSSVLNQYLGWMLPA